MSHVTNGTVSTEVSKVRNLQVDQGVLDRAMATGDLKQFLSLLSAQHFTFGVNKWEAGASKDNEAMPRPLRIQFEGASYHVFSRGNRRECIFRNERDYEMFESFLLQAMNRSGVQLFNWSQLPNHFHFNVATPGGNLAEFMQRLLTRYSKHFNVTYRLVGHLFQARYGARLIDREAYFQEIIRYVELNPYRTQGSPLAELGKWRWSSLHYLLQPEQAWPEGCRVAFQRVLEAFSADPKEARQRLLMFLADGLQEGTWEDFYRPKDGRFLGNDRFVERMKATAQEPVRAARRELKGRLNLEELLEAVEAVSGFAKAKVVAPGKGRPLSRWRQVLVCVARRYYRIPVVQLAKRLGRGESAISMMVACFEAGLEQWPEARQLLEVLRWPDAKNVKC